ncbi:MAG: ABC transporter permease [Pirellulales bacterium]|nr:ABC transporter permease [Pirellulales bacterium]
MYKLLLCWRYLRTRYIALASVISVTLGVATMIVVNSVMEGFTSEMQNRIHGIISDVVLESRNFSGAMNAAWHEERIRQAAGEDIEAMTPTVVTPAMLTILRNGQEINRPIQLIGIDAATQSDVSDFGRYLQHPENRRQMHWELREDGYDVRDHQAGPDAPERPQMAEAGWKYRRVLAQFQQFQQPFLRPGSEAATEQVTRESGPRSSSPHPNPLPKGEETEAWPLLDSESPEAFASGGEAAPGKDPFFGYQQEKPFDMATQQHTGIVLGIAMATIRRLKDPDNPNGGTEDLLLVRPGDDVLLWLPTVGTPPTFRSEKCTVVDLYESKMSEYDANFAFVPIRRLQELRGMIDPTTQVGNFNSIQMRLKPGAGGEAVRDKLRAAFPVECFAVETWRDKQGPLLSAVEMETRILNVLLFFIIAVAGFGILAIFFMIVVEKTRDIGILKSLGASSRGVMSIFLTYGLLLGAVGSGVGLALGLLFVYYINEVADLLAWVTGRPVFDPTIYYFSRIPTIIEPHTLAWIVLGAIGIAVAASIFPARRAARLHPVEALRYE